MRWYNHENLSPHSLLLLLIVTATAFDDRWQRVPTTTSTNIARRRAHLNLSGSSSRSNATNISEDDRPSTTTSKTQNDDDCVQPIVLTIDENGGASASALRTDRRHRLHMPSTAAAANVSSSNPSNVVAFTLQPLNYAPVSLQTRSGGGVGVVEAHWKQFPAAPKLVVCWMGRKVLMEFSPKSFLGDHLSLILDPSVNMYESAGDCCPIQTMPTHEGRSTKWEAAAALGTNSQGAAALEKEEEPLLIARVVFRDELFFGEIDEYAQVCVADDGTRVRCRYPRYVSTHEVRDAATLRCCLRDESEAAATLSRIRAAAGGGGDIFHSFIIDKTDARAWCKMLDGC